MHSQSEFAGERENENTKYCGQGGCDYRSQQRHRDGIDVLNRGFVGGTPYMNKIRGLTYGVQVEINGSAQL